MRTDIPDVLCAQEIMPGNTVPDIFTAMPVMPATVYVIASGPSAKWQVPCIPMDAYRIVCNTSIRMVDRANWWIAFDHRMVLYNFWETLQLPDGCKTLFSARLVNRLRLQPELEHVKPDYYFNYMPNVSCPTKLNPKWTITPADSILMPGILRGGMTVAGIAIQLAYYSGAKQVILCGVDMKGTGHWDGFRNPDPHHLCRGIWPWAHVLENLCDAVTTRGCKVYSMTSGALGIPSWIAGA